MDVGARSWPRGDTCKDPSPSSAPRAWRSPGRIAHNGGMEPNETSPHPTAEAAPGARERRFVCPRCSLRGGVEVVLAGPRSALAHATLHERLVGDGGAPDIARLRQRAEDVVRERPPTPPHPGPFCEFGCRGDSVTRYRTEDDRPVTVCARCTWLAERKGWVRDYTSGRWRRPS